jgi:pimeloyl-ACP methyl ester carboxylesterase
MGTIVAGQRVGVPVPPDDPGLGDPGDPGDAVDPDDALVPGGEARTVTTDDGATLSATVAPGAGSGAAVGADATGADDGVDPTARTTVVFAHGWTNNRSVWAPVAREVAAAGHPVVLYDQRGHGRSTLGDDPLGIERLGDDLAALLEGLDVRRAVLVGHSMGGFTSMSFVCRHPDLLAERVEGMVLVSTAAHGLSMGRMAPVARLLLGSPAVERVARHRGGQLFVRRVLGRRADPAHVRSTREMFVSTPAAVRVGYFDSFGPMDLRSCLGGVDVPVVVMVGSRDTLTPPRLGRAIADLVPGARYELLPDAGHMLPLERSHRVAAEVLSLLTG